MFFKSKSFVNSDFFFIILLLITRGLNIPKIAAPHFTVSIVVWYATTGSGFDTSPVVMLDPLMTLAYGMTAT
jgi:hypothetical protein